MRNYLLPVSLVILFFLNPGLLRAQYKDVNKKNQLLLSPIRAVHVVNPGIELFYGRQYSDRLATQVSYRIVTDIFGVTPYTNVKGYGFSVEQKYFFGLGQGGFFQRNQKQLFRQEKERGYYISLEFNQLDIRCRATLRYQHADSTIVPLYYTDSVQIHRKTNTVDLKIGRQFYFNSFFLDVAVGVGVRHKDVRHDEKNVPGDKTQGTRHPNIYAESEREGNYFTGTIPVTIRIGYRF